MEEGCLILNRMEAVMTTYYDFQSGRDPTLHALTDDRSGAKLPKEDGPWTFAHEIVSEDFGNYPVTRDAVHAGVLENGFYLWGPLSEPTSSKPVIESDRVEGTAVYDPAGKRIGTIKRLMIEKVSGRVLYVDITFGGFLGLGTHHYTIPWEKLDYDTRLGGYRTDITAEQVKGAPAFYGDDEVWPDRGREQETQDYWRYRAHELPPAW
jgi:sporulation protein YlmC with PRC-barrel domain